MILPAQAGAARVAIHRLGEPCPLVKPVDSDGVTDGYGKTDTDSWEEVATEPVVRVYQRGSDPDQQRVTGGRYRSDSPALIFLHDSAVQSGYRVTYQATVYVVDSLTAYPTHIEAETTVIN